MVYVRSFLVALLIMISAAAWTKDHTTTVPATSFNGPIVKLLPRAENGVYRLAFQTTEPENLTILVLNENRELVYRKRLKEVKEFSKEFRLSSAPEGTYRFIVRGKGWQHEEAIQFERIAPAPLNANLVFTDDPERVLLQVDGSASETVLVTIRNAYNKVLFQDYVELNEAGIRPFNLAAIPSGRIFFEVRKDEVSSGDLMVLR